jgi:prevent-host-death family protein
VIAISTTVARANLDRLIDQVNESSEPVTITGRRASAVLVGESAWRGIDETLRLESVSGLTESVRQALIDGVQEGSTELDW